MYIVNHCLTALGLFAMAAFSNEEPEYIKQLLSMS